jgi:short-subunit dehydrogenase
MFKDKVIWITGASSGIGEALALEFVAQGSKLILSSRRKEALNSVKECCVSAGAPPENIMVLPMDMTDEATMAAKVISAKSFTGRIDMLINNAGISQRSLFIDTQMDTYRKLFEVDVFGQIALTKHVAPIMIKQGEGHIAVTASVAGKIGAPFRTGYCAAKHAVMGFFDALRVELTQHNIKVTTITPGFIRTDISKNALSGDGSNFDIQDTSIAGGMEVGPCAKVIMRGFEKGAPEIAVGKGFEMHLLWIKRLFPRLAFKLIAGRFDKMAKSNQLDK